MPKNPELVPKKYLPKTVPNETLRDLKWMMQKDLLGQDIFLLGKDIFLLGKDIFLLGKDMFLLGKDIFLFSVR